MPRHLRSTPVVEAESSQPQLPPGLVEGRHGPASLTTSLTQPTSFSASTDRPAPTPVPAPTTTPAPATRSSAPPPALSSASAAQSSAPPPAHGCGRSSSRLHGEPAARHARGKNYSNEEIAFVAQLYKEIQPGGATGWNHLTRRFNAVYLEQNRGRTRALIEGGVQSNGKHASNRSRRFQ
jgi:hypothetical protein